MQTPQVGRASFLRRLETNQVSGSYSTSKARTTVAAAENVTDLTRGIYRRVYAGQFRDRSLSSVSLEAEAWYWRLTTSADDFGNFEAEPQLCRDATAGRRSVTADQVAGWLDELANAKLIHFYDVEGERYAHIAVFEERQPAGKNGKRVRRFPPSPWDGGNGSIASVERGEVRGDEREPGSTEPDRVNPGESKGIQGIAGAASATHSHSHDQNQDQYKPAAQASAEPATGPTSPEAAVLTFPTVGGRKNKATTWALTEWYVAELREQFPAVDVTSECRKALGWVQTKPANRKTADGMKEFLWRWMKREQNSGARSQPAGSRPPTAAEQRRQQQLEALSAS